MPIPWTGCKVSFDIQDEDVLWKWHDKRGSKARLPEGWSLTLTDGTGARCVAVFQVIGLPTIEAGEQVAEILSSIDAVTRHRRKAV